MDQKTTSTIAELGGIQEKGDFVYRYIKMADGTDGEHWSKDKKVLEAQDALKEDKVEVEYTWVKGASGKGDKLRVYAPKDSAPSSGGEKKPYKEKSDWTKGKEDSDNYWKNKTVFEEARALRNDIAICRQTYQALVAPFYLPLVTPDTNPNDVAKLLDIVVKVADALYDRYKPTV